MWSIVPFLILTAIIVQQVICLTRTEIQQQYSPILQNLKTLGAAKFHEFIMKYDGVHFVLQDNQANAKKIVQAQFNSTKTTIANAKKNVTSATVLNCLKIQEAAVTRLEKDFSLGSCYTTAYNPAINAARNKFTTMSNVAASTVSYCSSLNPLTSQDDTFERCLSQKIPDLNRQINMAENEYHEASNRTLHSTMQCLTDMAGFLLGEASVISFEINVCLFAPL